ncbi:aldehyde dehydrogenase family protein [Pseudactinotalea sp. Z1739]|uniref:aldehyde dehydrogenase family protein n=1 Tax=Pseudactinotalea sp. Z1739 TaxID=3413028 RepID=UPI003C7DEE26
MSATTTSHPMSEVLRLQRKAFHRDGPPDAATRRERIDRFARAVVSHSDELAEAISADFGNRPPILSLVADVAAFAMEAETLRSGLGRWMRRRPAGSRVGSAALRLAGMPAWIQPSPLGVVGVMGVWNYPINFSAVPAVSALAAGNRVMIKMSEEVPQTAEVFANAIHDAFDVEEVAVLTGDVQVSKDFAALDLDHLLFTGSAATGSQVMAAAAANLTPVTLELGGKNPVVISEHTAADRKRLRRAAERVARSRLINGGQTCLCPERVYVPEEATRTFVQEVFNTWGRDLPELFERGEVTTIINEEAHERIEDLLADAENHGAQVIGSVRSDAEGTDAMRAARLISPTVVLNVTEKMRIDTEEVFGPVLQVQPYRDLGRVLDDLAERPAPLVSTWFGPDDGDFRTFVARTRSGGVARNDFALTNVVPGTPFGGVGASGIGHHHGKFGFDRFSHLRTVGGSNLPVSVARLLGGPGDTRVSQVVRGGLDAYSRVLGRRLR